MALGEWYSGDHHFHLNYGGQTLLAPEALLPMLRAEDLDVATPLSANLHTRRIDEGYFNWTRSELPVIRFGQEVRSHFLGHTGHVGIKTLYWPWYWGPGYPVYGLDDRSNREALQKTRSEGGVNSYVHPVTNRAPFGGKTPTGVPLELVSDAVLGDVDTIELACLWSDELGTSDVWHRLLNVGVPLAPSAGTDAMVDFFRTMAIGTTRVYVHVPQPFTFERYLAALKAGRSFVSTGPLLQFSVDNAMPGDAIKASGGSVAWTLSVASALPFERVEVLVNGEVVWDGAGLDKPGTQTFKGTVKTPAGGWIAARVRGGTTEWPAMDSFPFAHTAPIWFGSIGSTDRAAAQRAAVDLLAALDVAESRIRDAYKEVPTPLLLGRINAARQKLAPLDAVGLALGTEQGSLREQGARASPRRRALSEQEARPFGLAGTCCERERAALLARARERRVPRNASPAAEGCPAAASASPVITLVSSPLLLPSSPAAAPACPGESAASACGVRWHARRRGPARAPGLQRTAGRQSSTPPAAPRR